MMICMAFPGGKRKALTLSYDDGVEQDVRLLSIMKENGLKGTFNLNSGLYAPEGTVYKEGTIHRRMTEKAARALYADSGMEVALHGYRHGYFTRMTPSNVAWEIMKDKETMEAQYNRIVRGFAYPYGAYDDRVVDTLRACGIAYARTTVSTHTFDVPSDWLRMGATCHHNDPQLMSLAKKFKEENPRNTPWIFYLWGHSYEFEERDNWDVIERFAGFMGGDDSVWYATNIQIHDYAEAWKKLISSADGRLYYNPTAIPLCFVKDGRDYEVLPGQEISLD